MAYGINRKSLLTEVPHFDICKQMPPDLMHILLEGVIQHTLKYLLRHYIIEERRFILDEFNAQLASFNLWYMNANAWQTLVNGDKDLRMDASQSWMFFRIFPFLIANCINLDDDVYLEFYRLLAIITGISFSKVIVLESIALLTSSVKNYLTLYKELFPQENVTPKQHYLVHFPRIIMSIGPLVNFWCMRFEAKHAYFKSLKNTCNFKNITLSLSRRHQKWLYANLLASSEDHDYEYGPQIEYELREKEALRNKMAEVIGCRSDEITAINKIKWVKIHGTKYLQQECYVLLKKNGEGLPQFAKIVSVFFLNHSLICFEVLPVITHHFDDNLHAYNVTINASSSHIIYILQEKLLIPDALQTFTLQMKTYINIRHDKVVCKVK